MGDGDALVLLSGGIDSAVVAFWAKDQGFRPVGLMFDYGQLVSRREGSSARRVARVLGIPLKVISIESLEESVRGEWQVYVRPRARGWRLKGKPTMAALPFRSGILLAIAFSYTCLRNVDRVLYGEHKGDWVPNAGDGIRFKKALQDAGNFSVGGDVVLEAPLYGFTKAEIVKLGVSSGVPFSATWSCQQRSDVHCGVCQPCVNRKEAFRLASVRDPTRYAR